MLWLHNYYYSSSFLYLESKVETMHHVGYTGFGYGWEWVGGTRKGLIDNVFL
jgi:hypothetical protein